jgi:hypothetical protein
VSDADQLQDLVDGLAARVGCAVMLDDPRLRLIAYSETDDDVDPVRVHSILRRESPHDVREWLFAHGLHELREPTPVAALEELGMRERLCCPVRHDGVLLGYLWVLGTGDALRAPAGPVADAAGAILFRRRLEESYERTLDAAALAEAVFGHGAGPVASVRLPGGALEEQAALERALRRHAGGKGRCLAQDGDLVLAGAPEAALRAALAQVALVAPTGIGRDLGEARRASLIAELLGSRAPLGVDDLPLEAHLLQAAGDDPDRVLLPAIVEPLLAPPAAELRATLETYLDAGGDVQATAATLHISRAGLYRRLHRAEQDCRVDLHDGPQRTLVHLGLKAARLLGR